MRFLMELIDAKDNVDVAAWSRDKNEVAIFVATSRLEVDLVFASDVVRDDEVT